MRVFWDTNLFIYLIEQHPAFHSQVLALYQHHRDHGEQVVTSVLTLGELLTQPLRHGRADLAQRYTDLLTRSTAVHMVAFDRSAATHYTKIRAETSLRQPDAIQFACAAAGKATTFITNDQRLWGLSVPGIEAIRGL